MASSSLCIALATLLAGAGCAHRIFSNPRSDFCGGAPCGVDNVADNARSLAQTMPIVAAFRATVVPDEQEVTWELCELMLPAG
jgi:hypothetical protein